MGRATSHTYVLSGKEHTVQQHTRIAILETVSPHETMFHLCAN
jgi:hypothetical protein